MSRFISPRLSGLEPYTPGEQPRDMKDLIKLNTNESPFPPSPRVLEAIGKEQLENLRLYPDPACTCLVTAIADFYGVGKDHVLPGNGSDEVLAFCFHGLCPNGAVFPDITYGFYSVFSEMFGVEMDIVPLREDYSVAVEDYIGRKGTVFIANPNAPTGLCLPLSDIAQLCRQDENRLVIVDEAYVDFGGESAVKLLSEFENLLVIQTFSKSRQLAGGRLGFAIGSKELISDLNALKFSFNPYSVNNLTLLAGTAAMEDREYFEKCTRTVIANREYTAAELKKLGCTVLDSRTNFVFAGHPQISGGEYNAALRSRGILVRYFPGERTKDFVRVTIGTKEQMEKFISATKEILKERS